MRGKSGRTAGEVFWRPLLAFEAVPLWDGVSSGWLVTITEGAPVLLLSLAMAVGTFAWAVALSVPAVVRACDSPLAKARWGFLATLSDWGRCVDACSPSAAHSVGLRLARLGRGVLVQWSDVGAVTFGLVAPQAAHGTGLRLARLGRGVLVQIPVACEAVLG